MAEKTMTASFIASPEAINKLFGMGDEYIVKAPWERVRWCLKDGTVKERKQDIRERITRCRDCAHAHPCPLADSEKLMCAFHDEMFVNPDDFCSWGKPRESDADD